jgi:hypothetical protein
VFYCPKKGSYFSCSKSSRASFVYIWIFCFKMLEVTFFRHDYSCMEKDFILHNITSTVITVNFFFFWLSRFNCTFSSHEWSYKFHRKHDPLIVTTPHFSTLMSYECCHWTSFRNETHIIEKQNNIYKITAQSYNVSGKCTHFIRNCKLRASCNNWISRSMKEKLNA